MAEEPHLTSREKEAIDLIIRYGLADERRLAILVELVNGAQAWSLTKRFIFQFAAGIGAIGAIAAAVFWIRDYIVRLVSGGP